MTANITRMTETKELHGAALLAWVEGPNGQAWFATQPGKHSRADHLARHSGRYGVFGDVLDDDLTIHSTARYHPWPHEILSRMRENSIVDGHPQRWIYEPKEIEGLPSPA